MTSRAVTFGGTSYPLVLPTIRDPRLHVAGVIITIHVLGQVGLHFRVSVPQILAAILTCAIIEVVLTFRQTRSFVWPASAMLTGSGVALILRVVGHTSGRSVEHVCLVCLRGRRRPVAPDEVRHPLSRLTRLQPVQHRPGARLRDPRQHTRRATRLLVGPPECMDDRRVRRHHRRRIAHHPAIAPSGAGGHVLGHAGDRDGRSLPARVTA